MLTPCPQMLIARHTMSNSTRPVGEKLVAGFIHEGGHDQFPCVATKASDASLHKTVDHDMQALTVVVSSKQDYGSDCRQRPREEDRSNGGTIDSPHSTFFPGGRHKAIAGSIRTAKLGWTEDKEPLIRQVVRALDPEVCLDFPALTEICDAMAADPAGADVVAAVLVATLGHQALKPGDTRNITKDYLKVLTMINEMVYHDDVVKLLRHTPGLTLALERLKTFTEGDMGDVANDNIRMLATEIEKTVFQAARREDWKPARLDTRAFCSRGHPMKWRDGPGFLRRKPRHCAMCFISLPRTVERYSCRKCKYDVCIDCVQRGKGCAR
eukprot:TRINITY_DN48983_c0_g1_i1.p1 TRINITY_DN48983_c0_g1~~TRINITY_DN48983_c0_g1_i1.p1  ORF type:complete len:325 (-),score=27.21 TRINITY_DN48983_c0_g1_i1:210-1184(-)